MSPAQHDLTHHIVVCERNGLLRQLKGAIQRRVGPAHVAEPIQKHKLANELCERITEVSRASHGPLASFALEPLRGEVRP
jgi:hypothetical protein